jgi:hypothetical protein
MAARQRTYSGTWTLCAKLVAMPKPELGMVGPIGLAAHRIALVRRCFLCRTERLLAREAAESAAMRVRAAAHTPRWCRVPITRPEQ